MKKLLCGLSIYALAMMCSSSFAGNVSQTTYSAVDKSSIHLVADDNSNSDGSDSSSDNSSSNTDSSNGDSSSDDVE